MVLARVLVVDPPWYHGDQLPGKRGATKHYACMSLSAIMRMALPPIAQDAVLFLWRVSAMVEEAYQVVRAWDFVPKSEIVWNKTSKNDSEKDTLGMGHIVRGSHETCIVARRGKLIRPSSRSERTSFRAPRGEHSEKPEEFYRLVERLYPLELWPEAHVELFARKRRPGWVSFGDQLPPPIEGRLCFTHGPHPGVRCPECAAAANGDESAARNGHKRRPIGDWEACERALAAELAEKSADPFRAPARP